MSIPILYATSVNKLTAVESIDTFQVNANVYLSGGINLLDILSGGTGREDVNTLVIENSGNWNSAYNTATAYQSVSGNFVNTTILNSVSSLLLHTSVYQGASGNWQDAYTNLVTNSAAYLSGVDLTFLQEPSANWNSTYTTVQSNSSNWQNAYNTATVYQTNSSSYATTAYTDSTYLPLSGGTLTGNLSVYGNTFINNNLTIGGSLTALGTATFANTIFTTTSALSVYNTGPGPALYVYQASGPYDVASFYDGDGIEVLHVGNAGPGGFGKVGVNESFPNEELTVRGSISATESIFATSILSGGVDLKDIFLTTETDSQTLTWNPTSYDLSISNGNTVSLGSLSSTGGGVITDKKFDYVTVLGIDYSYSGTAVQGTLETSLTWKLIRLTYANNGTISNSASAIDSWTGRLTAAYV